MGNWGEAPGYTCTQIGGFVEEVVNINFSVKLKNKLGELL
jgi:hypothetical protein